MSQTDVLDNSRGTKDPLIQRNQSKVFHIFRSGGGCLGGVKWRPSAHLFPRALGPRKQGARDPGSEEPGTQTHCVTDQSLGQPAGYTGPRNQNIQKRFRFSALVVQATGGVNVLPVTAALWGPGLPTGPRSQGPWAQEPKTEGPLEQPRIPSDTQRVATKL